MFNKIKTTAVYGTLICLAFTNPPLFLIFGVILMLDAISGTNILFVP